MKIFIKLLILLLILACASPFFIKGPNGTPLMSINQLKLPEFSMPSSNVLKEKIGLFKPSKTTTQKLSKGDIEVFKWRDENGVVHYSDRQDSHKKGKLTQIKGITILPTTAETQELKQKVNSRINLPSSTTIPSGDISKLITDAKQVEQVLQQRKLRQDEVIDGLR